MCAQHSLRNVFDVVASVVVVVVMAMVMVVVVGFPGRIREYGSR